MIELKAKSENYIPKEELEEIDNEMLSDSEKMLAFLQDLVDKEFEVEIQLEHEEIFDTIWEQEDANVIFDYAKETTNNETIAEYLEEQGFIVKESEAPLLASNFNAYEFKRRMCDLFETGYHVDSFDLVKLLAKKLQVDYLL